MNGVLLCKGVAGPAADANGVELCDNLHIDELRFRHMTHLLFICGKTIAQLLSGAQLQLDDGRTVGLEGVPKLSIPCRMFEVPYRLTDLTFPLPKEPAQQNT